MNRFLAFAALCGLSLSACAQQPAPDAGQKITIGPKAAAEPVYATGTPEARARAVLRELNPQITVESIKAAPIPGFREVIATGQVVYVSDDGKYLFQGGLLDIAKRKDMAEAAMAKSRVEPASRMGPPKGPVALRVSAMRQGAMGTKRVAMGGPTVEVATR